MNAKHSVTIGIYYPGMVITVNHYRGRRRDGGDYVKNDALAWREALGWLIKSHHIEDWQLPLSVTCSGVFRDGNHAPDLSNLSKCTLEAIQEVTGINDKDMRWHDGDRLIDAWREPELYITIEEAE